MVNSSDILLKFEIENDKKINNSYIERLKIFESMLEWKNRVLKDENPLNGLEEKIAIIKRLHSVK